MPDSCHSKGGYNFVGSVDFADYITKEVIIKWAPVLQPIRGLELHRMVERRSKLSTNEKGLNA